MNRVMFLKATLKRQRLAVRGGIIGAFLLAMACLASPAAGQADSNAERGREIRKNRITSYIIRDVEDKQIRLTMLIAHKSSFDKRVRNMPSNTGGHALLFSVSTAANQLTYFEPANLEFRQGSRTFRPNLHAVTSQIIELDETVGFGGVIKAGETHQAIIMLPAEFDIDQPIYVKYSEHVQQLPITMAVKN